MFHAATRSFDAANQMDQEDLASLLAQNSTHGLCVRFSVDELEANSNDDSNELSFDGEHDYESSGEEEDPQVSTDESASSVSSEEDTSGSDDEKTGDARELFNVL